MNLLLLIAASAGQQPAGGVAHPEVPCRTGGGNWTAPGKPASDFAASGTEGAAATVTIEALSTDRG